MNKAIRLTISVIIAAWALAGCSSGGDGTITSPPPPPPPPPPAQSVAGTWGGQSVTAVAPDAFTSFEFNATGGFSTGTAPYTATFSNGNAETRGIPSFYITGLNAWHILIGTSATVDFETLPNTLSFFVRMPAATDVGEVRILDENSTLIQTITPTEVFQQVTMTRTAGQTLIGSVEVTSTSGGDVVIDDLTFGYDGAGFTGGTDDIGCTVTAALEIACLITDSTTGAFLGGARGTVQVVNNNQVTGTGTVYTAPGETLANGKSVAPLTVSGGTVSTGTSLDLVVDAAGATSAVSTSFDSGHDRGSDLATVAAAYSTFDIFGDPSSFVIDATGVVTGQSNAGCVLNGQVDIIDASVNVYDLQLDVTSCGGLDGSHTGFGITQDTNVMDDTFLFGVFTAQTAIFGGPVK